MNPVCVGEIRLRKQQRMHPEAASFAKDRRRVDMVRARCACCDEVRCAGGLCCFEDLCEFSDLAACDPAGRVQVFALDPDRNTQRTGNVFKELKGGAHCSAMDQVCAQDNASCIP